MNMLGSYCGFYGSVSHGYRETKDLLCMQPFQGLSSKMDDKTLRKEIISTLDSNTRIEAHSVALGNAGFAGSALWSLNSALDLQCGEQLGTISRAPEPCLICTVQIKPNPSMLASFLFLSSKGPTSWSRRDSSLSSLLMTVVLSAELCQPSKAGSSKCCRKSRDFSPPFLILSLAHSRSQMLCLGKAAAAIVSASEKTCRLWLPFFASNSNWMLHFYILYHWGVGSKSLPLESSCSCDCFDKKFGRHDPVWLQN